MTIGGPGLIKSTAELTAPQMPANLVPPPNGPNTQASWQEQQMAQQAALEARPAQAKAAHDAEEAHIDVFFNESATTETISGKFAQGALDALLAPGALAG